MTDKVFSVADNGTPAAAAAAGKLNNGGSRRIGAPEAVTSETVKDENPFKVMAQRQAQAASNEAAADLAEEKPVEAPAPVVAAPQVEAAPPAPVPEVEKVEEGFQFAYGPDYWPKVEAFVGCKINASDGFNNLLRHSADYDAYLLPDDRVVKIRRNSETTALVRIYPDWAAFETAHSNDFIQKPAPKPKSKVAAPAPTPAAPPAPAPVSSQRDLVISTLLTAPARIFDSQRIFDETDRLYKARLAELSIKALSEPMFPGKKDGDPNRAASNDTERDLAIQKLVATDMQLINFAASREAALRELMRDRNTFEAAKLAAQLLSNQAA